jgi:hypothetical protein
MESHELFAWGGLEPALDPLNLSLTDMSHHVANFKYQSGPQDLTAETLPIQGRKTKKITSCSQGKDFRLNTNFCYCYSFVCLR